MKRIGAIVIILLFVVSLLFYAYTIEKKRELEKNISPVIASLTVYTDIPSNIAVLIAKEYEEKYHVKVNMLLQTEEQMADLLSKKSTLPNSDLVITSKSNLQLGVHNDKFGSIVTEESDIVGDQFKDVNGKWVGIWYDPIVFVMNENYFKQHELELLNWQRLASVGSWSVIMPDLFASYEAGNILFSFVEEKGEEQAFDYFIRLKRHVTQYSKFLSTPIRLVALQEVDVGIGPYSIAKEYMGKHYPIRLIYPQDGTPYYLIGVAMIKNSKQDKIVKNFISWLQSKELYELLSKNNIYYIYTNPEIVKPKDNVGYELELFDTKGDYTIEGQKELLKKWLNKVRF